MHERKQSKAVKRILIVGLFNNVTVNQSRIPERPFNEIFKQETPCTYFEKKKNVKNVK